MELLLFALAVAVLGILAMRFGPDSRRGAYSKEEESASLGMTAGQAEPSPSSGADPSLLPSSSISDSGSRKPTASRPRVSPGT